MSQAVPRGPVPVVGAETLSPDRPIRVSELFARSLVALPSGAGVYLNAYDAGGAFMTQILCQIAPAASVRWRGRRASFRPIRCFS
jgi:hypothetical protein